MFTGKVFFVTLVILGWTGYSLISAVRVVKRDYPCTDLPFRGSPDNTKHPVKGEKMVKEGRTLDMEAASQPELKRATDFAKSDRNYTDKILPYGKRMGLDGNETLAIFSCTLDSFTPALHDKFNEALRNGDNSKYPIFHYWLDSGIKKLLKRQGSEKGYHYRGNSRFFSFTEKITTFPGFTSTSKDYDVAKDKFWKDGCTMIKISTNLGADISMLSNYSGEDEVLFPPYESFRVGSYSKVHGIPTITFETQASSQSGDCRRRKRDTRYCNPGPSNAGYRKPVFFYAFLFNVIFTFVMLCF